MGILLMLFATVANGSDRLLSQADSLFQSQKYTEAFSVYEALMDQGSTSASMLLKMAFIQDASDNYAEALYYLDLYYQKSADRLVIGKIEELAEEHTLAGYSYDDSHYFLALLARFKNQILILLFSVMGLLLAYIVMKARAGEKAFIPAVFQVLASVLLLLVINISPPVKAIVANDQALLRSGPSAGAEPVEFIDRGHKVTVIDQSDVWTKILWNGEEVFVRNDRLKII